MYTDYKIKTYIEISLHWPIGQDIVLTAGVFDNFHVGHLEHLEQCRRHGSTLVVCVGSDATVRELKGAGRPIIPAKQRARILAALSIVDIVVVSEEHGRLNFTRLMQRLRPQKLVVPVDDPAIDEKRVLCKTLGVEMVVCDLKSVNSPTHGISTTQIVTQVCQGKAAAV